MKQKEAKISEKTSLPKKITVFISMKKDDYNFLWKQIIQGKLDDIMGAASIGERDSYFDIPLHKKGYEDWENSIQENIYLKYEENKKSLKTSIQNALIPKSSSESKKRHLFDRHKLSALFMVSVMQIKPFKLCPKFRGKEKWVKWEVAYANHSLAYHIGLAVTICYKKRLKNGKSFEETFKTFNPKEIEFPSTDYNNYENNIYFLLQTMGVNELLNVNILKLSKIFFHIEEFNKV